MHNVVMVVGNTGVGKSSLGNRMLGYRSADSNKPFVVPAVSGRTVTQALQTFTGTWFREEPGSKLTVVDTPGKSSLCLVQLSCCLIADTLANALTDGL